MKRQTLTLIIILAFLAGFLFHSYLKPASNKDTGEIIASATDTTMVKQLIFHDFPKAYQKGDYSSSKIADLFFEDVDMVILNSDWITTQKEIIEKFEYLKDFPEGRTIFFELESIYFIGNTIAWVNVNSCDKGGFNEKGKALDIYCDRGSFLLEKREGKWKIKALRAFEPPLEEK